jgi:heme exporter protein A
MRPDAGDVVVNHFHLPGQADGARRNLGVVFHHPMVYGDLNARENMMFHARMHHMTMAEGRIDPMLEDLGLDPGRDEPVRTYSRGMLQRLALAKALLPEPDVLLLDEPFTGLDVQAGDRLSSLLKKEAERGCTILFSDHDLAGVEKVASRFVILVEGRVAAALDYADLPEDRLTGLYQRATNGASGRV